MSVKRQRATGRTAGGRTTGARAARTRVAGALAAAACAAALLPGTAWAAGDGGGYAFEDGAQPVQGAVSHLDAEQLRPGKTYRDTIKKDGKLYYRVDLDAKQNAYVSVVAVPKTGGKVAYGDGIKVSMRDGSNNRCGSQEADFGSAEFARPITAYADRTIDPDSSTCREQGAYYVLVERDSAKESDPADWELEIRFRTEPGLTKAGPTALPSNWPSATPAPPTGGPQRRDGGAGFGAATSLKQGEWRTDIRPGQTLIYRVPVDWGQQLFVRAELGSSPASDEYLSHALALSLENQVLGHVSRDTMTYSGDPATMALQPERPVAYENRFSGNYSTSAVRFAGWYYVSATLSPAVAKEYGDKPLPLTLRVNLTGQPKDGPAYDGPAGSFAVTDDDRDAAASGQSGPQAARSDTMKVVGVAGIGAGGVLLLGLGAWWLLARRSTA
ncbi:hypothetical protein RGF97_16350 [Streptomyces roseicoloratus]|uniref:Aromatic ring-opening dioxygenase LigA n=1 Tax=Streptomyces roseicoloratus TaxID=2508722 RepID=A0ABY9RV90_9ACTN|nr:hypothetical protein [Streptomyces roseicoloratus]WMX46101.1 hypothetical protein RGF97_16350 [Streptomyces roseicoloratus]